MANPAANVILSSVKALLGLPADYSPFDLEVLLHINSIVSDLKQLNVGPEGGLLVDEETEWSALLGNDIYHNLENVKTYIFLSTKLSFDASSMGAHHISAIERQIEKAEWRINHAANPAQDHMLVVLVDDDDV